MISMVMMALGVFRFGAAAPAYQEFTRSAGWRWQKLDRLGRAPALQFAGPEAEEITLSGVIYPHYKGGLRQMELLRARAGLGEPMMLVDGLGFVWQRWVIRSAEERKRLFLSDGAPREIRFSLTLQAYGRDRAQAAKR